MIIPGVSPATVLSGLQAVVGAAQGVSSILTGQKMPAAAGSTAPSAQTSTASNQFTSSTLASLISTQTNQGSASLQTHHHGHHHQSASASGASDDSSASSSITTSQSIAAPTPSSDSPSTGMTIGSLAQTAAAVALMI